MNYKDKMKLFCKMSNQLNFNNSVRIVKNKL